MIYREGPLSLGDLEQRVRQPGLEDALLVDSGRVACNGAGRSARYGTREFSVPLGATQGWEAAVFDHFQALVRTITTKLRGELGSSRADQVGEVTREGDRTPLHRRV